jgi:hypothetical protein
MPAGSLALALEASKQIGGIRWTVMAAGAGEPQTATWDVILK